MFDAVKFNGDKITGKDFNLATECSEILGVYQVKLQYDEDGDAEYIVTDNEPTGKLIMYKECESIVAMYFGNDVETNQLVDLL